MTVIRSIAACALAVVVTMLIPAPAIGQVTRLGSTFGLWAASVRGSDIAFDSKNKVYLAVSTMGLLRGRYISEDGVPLGDAFVIQSTGAGSHFPRVAFSPDAAGGAGGFLVTWHATVTGGGTHVYSRLVSYTQGLGTESTLAESDSFWEEGPAVAYATGSKEFLVAWHGYGSYVRYRRVGVNGVPLAAARIIDSPGEGERDPNVAYNSATDEFFVVYSGWDASSATVKGQRVKAGVDQPPAEARLLGRAAATYITDVSYDPINNQYLAAWYTSAGVVEGIVVAPNGDPIGSVRALSAYYKSYDALRVAFNTTSGTHFLISHGPTSEDGGVEIGGNGVPLDSGTPITAVGGTLGNFYPRVAAHSGRAEWTMTAAHEYSVTIAQRFGTARTVGPSCTISLPSAGTTFYGLGGTETITVTASDSSCAWNATSNADWLTITSGASRTGTATVSYSVAPNPSSAKRSGTLSIGGKSYTVAQEGKQTGGAFDVNVDGAEDILWQNQSTGHIAAWRMNGINLIIGDLLEPGLVPDTGWKIVATTDLNRDGYGDLLWLHDTGVVAYWLMRGEKQISGAVMATGIDTAWRIAAAGDMDGDGWNDIIWHHQDGTISYWYMTGVERRSGEVLGRVDDSNWRIVGARDMNGDRHTDLIWHHRGDGRSSVWFMENKRLIDGVLVNFQVPDVNWQIVGFGDHNYDGMVDFLWRNSQTGALSAWFMNGAHLMAGVSLNPAAVPDTNWKIVGPR